MRISEIVKKISGGGIHYEVDTTEGNYRKLSSGSGQYGLWEVGLIKDGEDALQFFVPKQSVGQFKDGEHLIVHNVLALTEEYEGKLQNKLKFSKESRIEVSSGFKPSIQPKESEREEVIEERIELSKEEKEKIVLDEVAKTYAQAFDIAIIRVNEEETKIKELIVKGLIMPLGFNEIVNSVFIQLSRAKYFGGKKGAEF